MRARSAPDPRRSTRRAAYEAHLSSGAWSEKRRQWYAAWLTAAGTGPSCVVRGPRWTLTTGHLHHATSARLGSESIDDLLPLCRRDREALHAAIDSHRTWRRAGRPTATAGIIASLRHALTGEPSDRRPSAPGPAS